MTLQSGFELLRERPIPQDRLIPLEVGIEAGCRVLYHALPTNDIVYFDLGLNLRVLPQEDLPYAAVLGAEDTLRAADGQQGGQWLALNQLL